MAFTKVVGPGIHTLSNILSHNINSSGIITATKFVGPFDNAIIGGGTTISSDGINVTGIVTARPTTAPAAPISTLSTPIKFVSNVVVVPFTVKSPPRTKLPLISPFPFTSCLLYTSDAADD